MPRIWILAGMLCLLTACSEPSKELAMPEAVPGGWKRTTLTEIPPAEARGNLRRLGVKRAFRAGYDGPTVIELEVYRMVSTAAAFEAQQTWRQDGKTMTHYLGDLFLTAQSPQPDPSALENFLMALEKSL